MKTPGCWRVLLIGVASAVMSSVAATAQTPATPLASFTSSPNSLIQYLDGNFYGTSGYGAGSTFFRMSPAGAVTVLHTFTAAEGGGALILGADGNFYGTTPPIFTPPGSFSSRAFRITPSGSVTLLASFHQWLAIRAAGERRIPLRERRGYTVRLHQPLPLHRLCLPNDLRRRHN
jgi:hypothetical protein